MHGFPVGQRFLPRFIGLRSTLSRTARGRLSLMETSAGATLFLPQ